MSGGSGGFSGDRTNDRLCVGWTRTLDEEARFNQAMDNNFGVKSPYTAHLLAAAAKAKASSGHPLYSLSPLSSLFSKVAESFRVMFASPSRSGTSSARIEPIDGGTSYGPRNDA